MNDLTNNNEKKENNSNFSKNNFNGKSTTTSYQDKISVDAWITLVILSLIGLVIVYGETMIIPAIPDLIQEFNIPYNTTSWILTAYLIAGAVSTPIVGKLSDIYGKKKILLLIMVIYTAGTSFGIIADDISTMIIVRVVQGIGMSVFPIAFTLIREKFPEKKLSIAQGILTSIFAAGGVIGLSLGATTIEYFGWRSTFISIAPLALILTLIIMRFIHVKEEQNESDDDKIDIRLRKSIDIKGAISLTVTISCFLISITLVGNSSPTDFNSVNNNAIINLSLIVLFSIITVLSLFIFIFFQRRTPNPLIDLNLLKDKVILPTNILLMIIGISMFMIYQTISILIRNPSPVGFGGSAIDAANVQLPFMLISLVISILSGFLISRFGNIKPTIIGSIVSVIGFSSLYMYHSTELEIIINLAIIAGGLSLAEVGGFNITLVSVSPKVGGISMGITVLLFLIGMSIGPAISGIYLETFQSPIWINGISYSYPSEFSYDMIFFTAASFSFVFLILALLTSKKILSQTSLNTHHNM
ncbi:MAG TPA: MFS transporter [Nitrososphaeraceae archaeon]|nr:MFS transporter [Nitrososphaeraceae archaeon]